MSEVTMVVASTADDFIEELDALKLYSGHDEQVELLAGPCDQVEAATVMPAPRPLAELQKGMDDLAEKLSDLQSSVFGKSSSLELPRASADPTVSLTYPEIQEHRHAVNNGTSSATHLDSLIPSFDASLESFSHLISELTTDTDSYFASSTSATPSGSRAEKGLKRRLKEVQVDWAEMVERDGLLKEELKEDKWLAVFRTAADQAEGMMDSLQKAVSQCSTLAFQITAPIGNIGSFDYEASKSAISNYEAKKKFYQPSVSKSLAMLEKGIKERMTRNGETLRRHTDISDRWRSLRDEMSLIDKQIPGLRQRIEELAAFAAEDRTEMLMDGGEALLDDSGSGVSLMQGRGDDRVAGRDAASPLGRMQLQSRALPRSSSSPRTLASPTRAMAASRDLPQVTSPISPSSDASSYFSNIRKRFARSNSHNSVNATPTSKPKGKSSPSMVDSPTPERGNTPAKGFWRRGTHGQGSRPGSPEGSTKSQRDGRSVSGPARPGDGDTTPKTRTRSPEDRPQRSHSPAFSAASSATSTNRRRSMLPVLRSPSSHSTLHTTNGARVASQSGPYGTPPPLPPMPDVQTISAKEARSAYLRSTMQTPETTLRERARDMPFYSGRQGATPGRQSMGSEWMTTTPPATPKLGLRSVSSNAVTPSRAQTPGGRHRQSSGPPSSFRSPSRPNSRATSRAGDRAGAATPSSNFTASLFIPNKLDELDMALYSILQSIPNDIAVERLDPPLRKGQLHVGEWKAQYAFVSGRYGRRTYNCRLLELNRPGTGPGGKTQKVMARVNGVWVDLRLHILELV